MYLALFLSAFIAATIFPAQSEAVLVSMIFAGEYSTWALILVASIGNILGSVVSWGLGRGIEKFKSHRWFPVKGGALEKAQMRYSRYGRWSLLLSWAPIIGDPLTLVAGVMREPFITFLLLVAIAKTGRYLILTLITLNL